jgi:cell division septation protein DedD
MPQSSPPAVQFSRKGLIIWIGLIIFVCFWMFVLGILVGRGLTPAGLETGKLEKELAELKSRMLDQEQKKVEAQAAGKSDEKHELGFYEVLKDPGKQKPFKPVKPIEPAAPKTLPVPKYLPPEPAPPRPAVAVPEPAPVPAVETPAPPKPKPAPVSKAAAPPKPPAAPASGRFSIQVASVQESQGAEKLVGELRKKGYQAYQVRSEVAGKGVWYRIRVGAFEDRGSAEKMLGRLKGEHYHGLVVSTR